MWSSDRVLSVSQATKIRSTFGKFCYSADYLFREKLCNLNKPVAPKLSDFYLERPDFKDESMTIHLMNAAKVKLLKTNLVES
jgi:hypothetical protein